MSPLVSNDHRDQYLHDRREHILDAATSVFENKGFAAANVAEIASLAGIAKGTIYLYFESKEKIFAAILNERSFVPLLADLLVENQPFEITLRTLTENFVSYMETHLPLIRMALADGIRFPDCAEQVYRESILKGNLILADYLEKQSKAGKIRPLKNPFLTAKVFMGMMMYHIMTQEVMGGKNILAISQNEWIDEVIQIFCTSMGVNTSAPKE
jgi:AcrR family transcriptional regulator